MHIHFQPSTVPPLAMQHEQVMIDALASEQYLPDIPAKSMALLAGSPEGTPVASVFDGDNNGLVPLDDIKTWNVDLLTADLDCESNGNAANDNNDEDDNNNDKDNGDNDDIDDIHDDDDMMAPTN